LRGYQLSDIVFLHRFTNIINTSTTTITTNKKDKELIIHTTMSRLRIFGTDGNFDKYSLNGKRSILSIISPSHTKLLCMYLSDVPLTRKFCVFFILFFLGEGDVEERFFDVPLDHDSPKKGKIKIFVRIIKEHEVPLKSRDKLAPDDSEESPSYC